MSIYADVYKKHISYSPYLSPLLLLRLSDCRRRSWKKTLQISHTMTSENVQNVLNLGTSCMKMYWLVLTKDQPALWQPSPIPLHTTTAWSGKKVKLIYKYLYYSRGGRYSLIFISQFPSYATFSDQCLYSWTLQPCMIKKLYRSPHNRTFVTVYSLPQTNNKQKTPPPGFRFLLTSSILNHAADALLYAF